MHATLPLLQPSQFPAIRRGPLQTLQVNVGYRCNQQCLHCHVNAGPKRKEVMSMDTVGQILDFLATSNIQCLDITGGAPELNPGFRMLVIESRKLGLKVMDRCNLTILEEPGQQDLANFLRENQVEIIASLPCYLEQNVNAQRGSGVFEKSIRGLQKLNQLGYAADNDLVLNLVYNPQGPVLPPPQAQLEQDYRNHLLDHYGVRFNHLFTITNMPIQRFGSTLVSKGEFDAYMQLLQSSHEHSNLEHVMCRSLVSVDWQGYLYDCDFNQMLNLPLKVNGQARTHIKDVVTNTLAGNAIMVANHCYACTAGQGSSCGGALE